MNLFLPADSIVAVCGGYIKILPAAGRSVCRTFSVMKSALFSARRRNIPELAAHLPSAPSKTVPPAKGLRVHEPYGAG